MVENLPCLAFPHLPVPAADAAPAACAAEDLYSLSSEGAFLLFLYYLFLERKKGNGPTVVTHRAYSYR